MTFDDFGLNADLMKAINEAGYSEPTPIQAQAIPKALADRDVLGIAQTGTGKTASFTLPMIERLSKGRAKARMPRSLILEPTRELAAQVADNFEKYGKYHKLSMALLIGGVSFGDQDKKIDRGVDVLIATPGRLLDHVERGKLMLTGVQTLVIDEADRMLDMGFIPDIERICKLIPFTRQTMLFSATMPPEIENLANNFMQAPARIEVARASTTNANITQRLMTCGSREKRKTLTELIRREDIQNAIVFCNRKRDVDSVAKALKKSGIDASPIHGDLDQSVRTRTLGAFKDGALKVLVASDVAARGLDIPEVSHVFNYDVPTHAEDYVHRIGRTGRAGRKGFSFTLATPDDGKYLDAVEKLIDMKIERATLDGDAKPDADDAAKPAKAADEADATETDETAAATADGEAADASDVSEATEATDAKASDAGSEDGSDDEQPKRRRRRRGGRGRGRSRKSDDAEMDAEADDAGQDAVAADAEDDTSDSRPARQDKSESKASDGKPGDGKSGEKRGRGRGGRNKGRDGGRNGGDNDRVIGMGDHVPAFILRPIRRSQAKPADAQTDGQATSSDASADDTAQESDAA
ncbi:DEAD/DEAH box helicase [Pyruvatibacter mobilis]|uniref:DEAD/DEAH box helicase n=1 Tax=Pyruvatibacter mobilis TaxID=1712261 RepID=UPI003BACCD0C